MLGITTSARSVRWSEDETSERFARRDRWLEWTGVVAVERLVESVVETQVLLVRDEGGELEE